MANKRVDVHHHFVPPFYVQALREGGGDPSGWKVPEWTLEKDLRFNDEEQIAFTFLSITAPGAAILPRDQQAAFCRQANDAAAQARAAHPTRYGFFATIPDLLLDPAAAHRELLHALDTLHADGVILYTRYGPDNHYLGHPDFRATWDLLQARRAVVFVHPTHPVDTALVNPALPQPMIDYTHETTRAAVDLIVSGTVRAHPDVRIILSHAGGTLPYLALRPAAMLPHVGDGGGGATGKSTDEFVDEARSFYFDTALSAGPLTLDLLKGFAKPGHVLFGSDFPYAPTPAIRRMDALVDEYAEKDASFVQSINSGAAVELFPRLADILGKSGNERDVRL